MPPAAAPKKPMNKWEFYIALAGVATALVPVILSGRADTAQTYEVLRSGLQDVVTEIHALEQRVDARLDAVERWLAKSDGYREARRFAAAGQPALLPVGIAGPPDPPAPAAEGSTDALVRRMEALPETL